MKTVIYCFTGTGNSLFLAKRIASSVGGEVRMMGAAVYGRTSKNEIPNDADVLGFVFPVYAWSYPETVGKFVDKMTFDKKPEYTFAVTDCGDSAANTLEKFGKLLSSKGVALDYANFAVMPNNYLPLGDVDDEETERDKLGNAKKTAAEIADAVNKRKKGINRQKKSSTDFLLSEIVNPAFRWYTRNLAVKLFRADDDCIGCGICEKVCPHSNITLKDGKPQWGNECVSCMACIHWCPQKAIQLNGKTKNYGRFRNPEVSYSEIRGE